MKRKLITLLSVLNVLSSYAQYSLEFNEAEFLRIPDPPYGGYVAHANWNVYNSNLTFDEADEAGAIIYPNHYFEGTSLVTCSYRYEYYRNGREQTGTGSVSYTISFKSNMATLNKTELTLNVGQTEKLSYTLAKSYGSAYGAPKMTWESSDDLVATVDKNGKVKALQSGHATITFDPVVGPPVTCDVTVRYIPPTGISFIQPSASVVEGKTRRLSYKLLPEGASAEIQWYTSDETIVKVSTEGIITGVHEGTAIVTATTDNGHSATCTVDVISAPKSVSLADNISVIQGYGIRITPILSPHNSESTYKWKSDDTSVASVSNNGVVTGRNIGETTLTVTTENGLSASCRVKVIEAKKGIDYRNANIRRKAVETLRNKISKIISK